MHLSSLFLRHTNLNVFEINLNHRWLILINGRWAVLGKSSDYNAWIMLVSHSWFHSSEEKKKLLWVNGLIFMYKCPVFILHPVLWLSALLMDEDNL